MEFYKSIILVFIIAILSIIVSNLFLNSFGLTPLAVGILIGLMLSSRLKGRVALRDKGYTFCAKTLLRIGVVLYGFKISFMDVYHIGYEGVIIAAFMVFFVFYLTFIFGVKVLKMDRELSALTSCGSSICGAAAVLGAEAVLKSNNHKTVAAIGTVVLFGTLFMFLLPIAYNLGFFDGLSTKEIGIFVGAVTHEVAHVVGASNAMSEEIQLYAIIEKMLRVMMLVPLLLVLPFLFSQQQSKKKISLPPFVLFFIAVVGFNSVVELPSYILYGIEQLDLLLLTMAMIGLGVETNIKKLKETGGKPFIQASFSAILLLISGIVMLQLF
ncbi:MAG: YeiH family protein [Campylobacterales bacterium]